MSESLLENLNEAQREATRHTEGPIVVFAGAGSGKTRVITYRIAYLLSQGVRPRQILAVTFTNKASQEMQERLLRLHPDGYRCHIATFHSACARWLREYARHLGFEPGFTIYDEADAASALKTVIKELFPDPSRAPLFADVRELINNAKMNGWLPSEADKIQARYGNAIPAGGLAIYQRYQEYLAQCQAMDFDDLLLNMLLLFRRNESVRTALQKAYSHILVDEFQDTNPAQLELIQHLSAGHGNVFVVGDDDQAIYSWRGALPEHILKFDKLFPGAKRVILEENYRSTSNIIEAASNMISCNKNRAPKKLFSRIPKGDPIEVVAEKDGQTEAWYVADRIKAELHRFDYSEFAVFYRTNAQSRQLEEAFRNDKIPYRMYGALRFYDRMEIKDLISYLRLINNPSDNISLKRILNVPTRGIGKTSIEKIEKKALTDNTSFLEAMRAMARDDKTKLGQKIAFFLETFEYLNAELNRVSLEDAVGTLVDAIDYKTYLRSKFKEQFLDKNENVHELSSAIAEYKSRNPEATLRDWIQQIALASDDDEDGVVGVSLMTLHAAKGLEFRRVFIVGTEEGLIPHRNYAEDSALIEEERRLFYVGMTRAKEKLTLLYAAERYVYNKLLENDPSRFLGEIPRHLLVAHGVAMDEAHLRAPEIDPSESFYSYEDTDSAVLREGLKVSHPTFGRGTIETIESNFAGKAKVTVRFDEFGLRRLDVKNLSVCP